MSPIWAIPVGVLSAICISGLVFFCWYFPRAYNRGMQDDIAERDAAREARANGTVESSVRVQTGTVEVEMAPGQKQTAVYRYEPAPVAGF
jgi:hypothetical protein